MNRETVISLAREAGLEYSCQDGWTSPTPENKYPEAVEQEPLERFAELVAKAERKRICDMLLDMHAKEERHNYYGFIARMIKESA